MSDEILEFIKGFEPVKDFFLNGYCYWFAKILEDRFGSAIIYLPIENHFVAYKNGIYYDANGWFNICGKTMIRWDEYEKYDKLDYERVIKNCINKEVNNES